MPVIITLVLMIVATLLLYVYSSSNPCGGCMSGNLTASQIAHYAQTAGFNGPDLEMAVSIALAESSGNPNALGDNGTSYGLWQIHLTVHPEFDGWNLYDPQTNANAAYSVYSQAGDSFTPWTTYNNGMAQANLQSVQNQISPA